MRHSTAADMEWIESIVTIATNCEGADHARAIAYVTDTVCAVLDNNGIAYDRGRVAYYVEYRDVDSELACAVYPTPYGLAMDYVDWV